MADPLDVEPEPLVTGDLEPYYVDERRARYYVVDRRDRHSPVSFGDRESALVAASRLNTGHA